MGLNLVSDSGEEYWINSGAWSYLLELAGHYGWEDSSEEGDLRLSAAEAASLADAIEKALNDTESDKRLQESRIEPAMEEAGFISAIFELASWLGKNRHALEEFVEFSKKGGFDVW